MSTKKIFGRTILKMNIFKRFLRDGDDVWFLLDNVYLKILCLCYLAIKYIPGFNFDKAVEAYINQEKRKVAE